VTSPFAAWEDEKRRRRRIALGLEPDTRPQMARRGLSREELIALADAQAEAELQRVASREPAPVGSDPFEAFTHKAQGGAGIPPPEEPYDYFAGWDETPGQTPIRQGAHPRTDVPLTAVLEAYGQAVFPEANVLAGLGAMGLGALGRAVGGERGERMGEAFGEVGGYTAAPGALFRGPKAAVKLAGLSGAGAAIGGEIAGPTGEIVGGVAAPLSPTGVRLAVRGGTAAVRGGARLAEEVGRTNAGNALLPPAPQAVAAGAKGRIIPVVTRATEADGARIQAFIDGFVPADRTG